MQMTFSEWRSGGIVGRRECQDCHMPWRTTGDGRPYRSHSFSGGHDRALLARSLHVAVQASRSPDGDVLVPGKPRDARRRACVSDWGSLSSGRTALLAGHTRAGAEPGVRPQLLTPQPERLGGDTVFVRRQRSDTRVPPPGFGPVAVRSLRDHRTLTDPRRCCTGRSTTC